MKAFIKLTFVHLLFCCLIQINLIAESTENCIQSYTVGNGGDFPTLSQAASSLNPGDVVTILNQVFSDGPQYLSDINGLPNQPITIIAQTNQSPIFRGGAEAVHLINCNYITIDGLVFEQQTENSLNIDDGTNYATPSSNIIVKNCLFRNIGANGNNDFLKMAGVDNFLISNCTFINGVSSGFGSGLDMVGCHQGVIQDCLFDDPGSVGVSAKGGSQFVTIQRNIFKNTNGRAVAVGGFSGIPYFRPPLPNPIVNGYEASDINVFSNLFMNNQSPVAFVGAVNSTFRNNTIYKPQTWVMRILQENNENGMLPCSNNEFSNNIIYLSNDIVEVNINPVNTDPASFTFSHNTWYNESSSNWTPSLPATVQNQAIVNPQFVNAANENFALSNQSTAIGTGFPYGSPATDFNQSAYANPPSRGAFSTGQSNIINSLSWVTTPTSISNGINQFSLNYSIDQSGIVVVQAYDSNWQLTGQAFENVSPGTGQSNLSLGANGVSPDINHIEAQLLDPNWAEIGVPLLYVSVPQDGGSTVTEDCDCPDPAEPGNTVIVNNVSQLENAINQANNQGGNMTIKVSPGVYALNNGFVITPNMSRLTIVGTTGNRNDVILRGKGWNNNAMSFIFLVQADEFTIAHLTLEQSSTHLIQIQSEEDADDFTAINVRFIDGKEQLLKVSKLAGGPYSDNGMVACSSFEFTAGIAYQNYTGGIDAHRSRNWIVKNNTFRDIRRPSNEPVVEHAIHFWQESSNITVIGNQIINCDRGIGLGLGDNFSGGHSGGIVMNNFVHTDRGVGIGLEHSPDTKVYNNTVITDNYPRSIEYRFPGTTNVRITNNLISGTVSSRDGGTAVNTANNYQVSDFNIFANAANYDYHLVGSPSGIVDSGSNLSEVTADIDCDSRLSNGGIDIGADELAGSNQCNQAGQSCNDGDPCTTGESYDSNCICTGGTFQDSDNDGVCDANDACPGLNDALIGQSCDDGDSCTTGEIYDANCSCAGGTFQDADNDGVCDANDPDDSDPCIPNACNGDCEFLVNPNFDTNLSPDWVYWGCAAASVNGIANISNIATVVNSWDVGFVQNGLTIIQGESYNIKVRARADANRTIVLRIGLGQSPWTNYYSEVINLTTTMDDYILSFTMNDVTDTNSGVEFYIGGNTTNIYIDDVSFQNADCDSSCQEQGQTCSDGDPCTSGETYDVNCNCTGGLFQDADNDGVCDANDPNDTDPCIPNTCQTGDCELVTNPNFDNPLPPEWGFWGCSATVINGEAALTNIITSQEVWEASLYTDNILVEQGETYIVKFRARASANRTMDVKVGQNGSPFSDYFYERVNLTTAAQDFTFTFTMTQATDANTAFDFFVGVNTSNVYIDSASLEKVGCDTGTPITGQCGCFDFEEPGNAVTVQNISQLRNALDQYPNGNVTIKLEPGIYLADYTIVITPSQTNVTIMGTTGDRDDVFIKGLGYNGSVGSVLLVQASNFTAAHLTVGESSTHAIQLQGERDADNFTAVNVRFVDVYQQMLKISSGPNAYSDNGRVSCSEFEFTSGVAYFDYTRGIDCLKCRNWIVDNNVFKNIRSPNSEITEPAILFWRASEGTIVTNNKIYNSDRGIGLGLGDNVVDGHIGGVVMNNFVHTNRDVGIGIQFAPDVKIYNNTVVTENYPNAIEYRFVGTTNARITNNLVFGSVSARNGGTATNTDNNYQINDFGIFADASNYDYHLVGSPSGIVDSGTSLGEVLNDIDCDSRISGAGIDIGADELSNSTSVDCPDQLIIDQSLTSGLYKAKTIIVLESDSGNSITASGDIRFEAEEFVNIENIVISNTSTFEVVISACDE